MYSHLFSVMDNCVTHKAALLMKTIIAICFLAIISSLSGFILDLFVPKNRPSRLLQRNAIPSIVTGKDVHSLDYCIVIILELHGGGCLSLRPIKYSMTVIEKPYSYNIEMRVEWSK